MSELENRLEYVRANVSITDVYLDAKENGTSTCPCCNSRGKFYVAKNSYFKCFSSHCELNLNRLGNDVVALYRHLNNLEGKGGFWTALERLEKSSGIASYHSVKSERHKVLEEALNIYQYYLWSERGLEALEYLKSRGFMEDTLRVCGVGYAPDSYSLRRFDGDTKSFKTEGLIDNDTEYYSRRIIFPIRDASGLVHFTGRYLGQVPTDQHGVDLLPRYKDTKTTKNLFSSKNYLAFGDCLSRYGDTLYLMEGYPDAMSLYQYGIPSAGILGLERLVQQASKLSKFTRIVCLFDNDRFSSDHPNYPLQYKSWRRLIPQLIDIQLLLPHTTLEVFKLPEDIGCKDINDWFRLGRTHQELLDLISSTKVDLVDYLIHNWGSDYSHHLDLIKLITVTNRGKDKMTSFIPTDITPIDYAMRLFK